MHLDYEIYGNTMVVKLKGELDHHVAEQIRTDLDESIAKNRCKNLIFNLSDMKFMDSSGIGVIIGRYKKISQSGGKVSVVQVSEKVDKIFSLAGMYRIISKYKTQNDALNNIKEC